MRLERSRLLVGKVWHRRARHTLYEFTHSAWYVEADLDELARSVTGGRSLAHRVLGRVRDRDHLDGTERPLADGVRARLGPRDFDAGGCRISLVTYPRTLGPLFNPVSFYLCRDKRGELRHVIAEVSNTHGDRELYDFPPAGEGPDYRSSASKRMYVSPFIEAAARYELSVVDEADRLRIDIHEYEEETLALSARIDLQRVPLTSGTVARVLIREPLVSAKTIALIAWHALRLRLRGVRWRRYRRGMEAPPAPDTQRREQRT